jgi:CubicO group peptidase (beta-lactamase class C family)
MTTLKEGKAEDVGMSAEKIQHVKEQAQRWVDGGVTPALVLLGARRGTIFLHQAFGCYGPGADSRKLAVSAIFPLASISKVIAATAALILVDDGVLGLNRPVQDYLPEFAGQDKEKVMVHHLLTHTSGLRDNDVNLHSERKGGTATIPPAEANQHPEINEWLYLAYDAPLSQPPGREMSYSGHGYNFLGEIIRRTSGMNFGEFAHQRIFEPLGMHDTFYRVPDDVRARLVHRPGDWPAARVVENPSYMDRPSASAGGWATAMDMAVFCQMFLNGGAYGHERILSMASVAAMTRNQIPGVPSTFKEDYEPEASRGYGWDIKERKKPRYHGSLDSQRAFTHQGGGGTSILIDPGYDLITIYFSVARGIMSPERYRPEWAMDLFTNMVTAAVVEI